MPAVKLNDLCFVTEMMLIISNTLYVASDQYDCVRATDKNFLKIFNPFAKVDFLLD